MDKITNYLTNDTKARYFLIDGQHIATTQRQVSNDRHALTTIATFSDNISLTDRVKCVEALNKSRGYGV